jgi:tetratricopeptide (TPR) repeat protein
LSLTLNPSDALSLGGELFKANRLEEAFAAFRAVAEEQPENFAARHQTGLALSQLKRYAEALPHYDAAMAILVTELIMVTLNKSVALGEQGRSEEGISLLQGLLRAQPNHAHALYNLGILQMQIEQFEEALLSFKRCLEIDPDAAYGDALFCRGFANLVLGNYLEGFRDFEHRLKDNIKGGPAQGAELRPGTNLNGKTVLVLSEMGQGDMIQFGRYVQILARHARRVYLVAGPGIAALFREQARIELVPEGAVLPAADYWAHMMGLAHVYETTVDSVPPPLRINYDMDLLRAWRKIIPNDGVMNVGLCWAGSPTSRYDEHRSVPLEMLTPLIELAQGKRIRFYSLQQTIREADKEAFNDANVAAIGDGLTDFRQTAHAMRCLDLVITVDTSVAHLAGTVGVPTWILVTRFRTYWLWIKGMITTPWYPSVELIRQPVHGNWPSAITVARRRAEEMLAAR